MRPPAGRGRAGRVSGRLHRACPNWRRRQTHFLCRAWLLLAGCAVITRGDNGRQPDHDVQTGLSNQERRDPEITCQSHQPQNAGCDTSRESWNPLKQWELSIRTHFASRISGKTAEPTEVRNLGIQEVLSAPRAPWQRAYVERVIGTIRRECLDHVIVFSEAVLYRHVKSFLAYYHESRTHLSLAKDSPEVRPVQSAKLGRIVAISQVGGLHHRYDRRAA